MSEPPNNKVRLSGTVAGQSFTLEARAMVAVAVLLIAGGVVGGYLLYLSLDKRLERGQETQEQHHIRLYDTLIQQNKHLDAQTAHLYKLLTTLDYNMAHPENRYPLNLMPPEEKP